MRWSVYSREQIPWRALEEEEVPEVWESLVGIRKYSSSRDGVISQQTSRLLRRRWRSSSCQKGQLREHSSGGTCLKCCTAWKTKCSEISFISFSALLKSRVQMQNPVVVSQLAHYSWLSWAATGAERQTQPQCFRVLTTTVNFWCPAFYTSNCVAWDFFCLTHSMGLVHLSLIGFLRFGIREHLEGSLKGWN